MWEGSKWGKHVLLCIPASIFTPLGEPLSFDTAAKWFVAARSEVIESLVDEEMQMMKAFKLHEVRACARAREGERAMPFPEGCPSYT